MEIVVAVTTAAFSCRVVCCRKRHDPGVVIYSATGNTNQQFTSIPIPVGASGTSVDLPPEYEEVEATADSGTQKRPL